MLTVAVFLRNVLRCMLPAQKAAMCWVRRRVAGSPVGVYPRLVCVGTVLDVLRSADVGFPLLVSFQQCFVSSRPSFFYDVTLRVIVVVTRVAGQPISPVFESQGMHEEMWQFLSRCHIPKSGSILMC